MELDDRCADFVIMPEELMAEEEVVRQSERHQCLKYDDIPIKNLNHLN